MANIHSDDDDDDYSIPESPDAPTDLSWVAQPTRTNDHESSSPPGKYDSPPQAWPDRRPINEGEDIITESDNIHQLITLFHHDTKRSTRSDSTNTKRSFLSVRGF